MAVTHFVTQFTHVSRHFGVYSRKQNKKCLGKTVLIMWFQICDKMAYVSTKLLLEKSEEKKSKTLLKMWSQKNTRSASYVPRIRQRLLTLSWFLVLCIL